MAGVLFMVYIPCDDSAEDTSGTEATSDNKREAKGPSSSKADVDTPIEAPKAADEESAAADTDTSPLMPESDSGIVGQDDIDEQKVDNSPLLQEEGVEKKENSDSAEYFTLEEAVQQLMIKLGITKDVWRKSDDTASWQISFVINSDQCDAVLKRLISAGLGTIPYTSVSMFPSNYHLMKTVLPKQENNLSDEDEVISEEKDDQMKDFLKSIKSRLTVGQVVEGVKSNTVLTFDYISLVILASIIAAIGLAENSSVILVASMLVSPIMGPILGGTFGYVIGNRDLARLGLKNELIGLGLCLLFGFISGLIAGPIYNDGANGVSSDSWPTAEMQGRGLARGLGVGVAIALPSGAGVALSILGGNTGSLVGVAISASLLPPAVNAGMLWAYALISAIKPPAMEKAELETLVTTVIPPYIVPNTTAATNGSSANVTISDTTTSDIHYSPPNCPELTNNAYEFAYTCSMPNEALILGIISLLLTILNIICIIGMSIIVLKIKEVAPHTTDSKATAKFWKNDLQVAREHYKTLKGNERMDLAKMAKELVKETTDKKIISLDRRTRSLENIAAERLQEELNHDEEFQEVWHLLPSTARAQFFSQVSRESEPSYFGDLFNESLDKRRHASGTTTQTPSLYDTVRNRQSFQFTENLTPKTINSSYALKDLANAGEKAFIYEVPKSHKFHSSTRTPRGLGRMMSCPENVVIKPVDKAPGKSAGRFMVTTIEEEDHNTEVNRRESTVDSKDIPRKPSAVVFVGCDDE